MTSSKLTSLILEYRFFLGLLAVYYVCFLLITPLGSFNPGVPDAHSYSLTRIDRDDDTEFYVKAKSLVVDQDFDYNNVPFSPRALCSLNNLANPKASSITPIGPGILWSPFVAIAHLLTKTLNAFWGMDLSENGFSNLYLAITCIGSSLYAFLGLVISFTLLTRYFSYRLSFLAIITVFIGNTLFYNTYVRMLMSHSPEFFTIALFILLYIKLLEHERIEDYFLFGISFGLLGLVRYENLFIFALMPMVDCLYSLTESLRNKKVFSIATKFKYYLGFLGTAIFVFSLQFVYFYIQTGTLFPLELREAGSSIMSIRPKVIELFWGPTRNILWGNPIVLIGAFGSLFFIKKNQRLGISLFLIIMASLFWLFWRPHFYWWGMDFGIRHLIKISVPLAFGYAALIQVYPFRYKKYLFGGLSLLIVFWEYLKIIQTPSMTPILSENFLTEALRKTPQIITTQFPSFLLGTESSYLRILFTYGIHLQHLNSNDLIYLGIIPLYVLVLGLTLLMIYLFLSKKYYKNVRSQRISIAFFMGMTLILFISGMLYPKKSPEKLYNDFRQACVIGYMEGAYLAAEQSFNQARRVKSMDDPVLSGIFHMMRNKIAWPSGSFDDPTVRETFKTAAKDSNKIIKSFGEEGLTKTDKEIFIDLGTEGAHPFLKSGWANDEGPYPELGYPTFNWAMGTNSELQVVLNRNVDNLVLTFKSRSFTPDQTLDLRVNGQYIDTIGINMKWDQYSVTIPGRSIIQGTNILTFHYKQAQAPTETGGKDNRKLAVAFDWIFLQIL